MASPFGSVSSFFHIEPFDGGETCRHAMDTCNFCGNPISRIDDIFMYRGDTPFCSEECRYHEMVMDEIRAQISIKKIPKRINRKLLMKSAARNEQRHGTSRSKSGDITCAANVPVAR